MAQLNAEWGRFQWKSRIAENSCGLADSSFETQSALEKNFECKLDGCAVCTLACAAIGIRLPTCPAIYYV